MIGLLFKTTPYTMRACRFEERIGRAMAPPRKALSHLSRAQRTMIIVLMPRKAWPKRLHFNL
jgi:hypothetical protein